MDNTIIEGKTDFGKWLEQDGWVKVKPLKNSISFCYRKNGVSGTKTAKDIYNNFYLPNLKNICQKNK